MYTRDIIARLEMGIMNVVYLNSLNNSSVKMLDMIMKISLDYIYIADCIADCFILFIAVCSVLDKQYTMGVVFYILTAPQGYRILLYRANEIMLIFFTS